MPQFLRLHHCIKHNKSFEITSSTSKPPKIITSLGGLRFKQWQSPTTRQCPRVRQYQHLLHDHPPPCPPSLAPNAFIGTIPRRLPRQDSDDGRRPIVLHIGDPIKYNLATYTDFSQAFDVIRPSTAERERSEFKKALKEQRWGDFSAIFRPFWGTGGEMGRWDADLISLLPISVKVFASAGAGFDWADTKFLGERGV